MEGLVLRTGGKLEKLRWDSTTQTYRGLDVTADADAYLMSLVRLDDGLVLMDVFKLLRENLVLQRLFRQDWAEEYVKAAFATDGEPYTGNYVPGGIEYLELCQCWEKDSVTELLEGTNFISLRGVGFELREEVRQGDWIAYKKGTRIVWAIDFTPLSKLVNLPLRFNPEVHVFEGNPDIQRAGVVAQWNRAELTLGQLLQGILWEISFNGSPDESMAAAEEIKARTLEIQSAIEAGEYSNLIRISPEIVPLRLKS